MLIAALIVAALLASVASAKRLAGPHARAAVIASAVAAHDIARAQGPCVRVYISTVNHDWASLSFRYPPSRACRRLIANGISLFHRRNGHWQFVTAGSSFRCPVPGVPTRVFHDLVGPLCENHTH